ncbi:hypothetical protein EFBL_1003 [Effusibacillus lacus]|uniref:O-antigen ligase-related domain-containing protein n=2 Tax=Effusibacillus lacus TaxID=1348429 RepID=A0A292YLL5_9BACL|nr:hypothetical protein EFBL_1003 [Effusibacillus lacus]
MNQLNVKIPEKKRGLAGWLLAGYVFFLPVQFPTGFGFRLAPSDLFLLIVLFVGIGRIRLIKSAWSIWHYCIFTVFVMGTFVAVVTHGQLTQYVLVQKLLGLLLLFCTYGTITTFCNDWQHIRWLVKVFFWGVVIHNLIAIVTYFIARLFYYDFTWINYGIRLAGMLMDPNAYGGLLVLAFTLQIVTSVGKYPLVKGVWGLLSALSLITGILLTFSRSAWIGLAFLMVSASVFKPKITLKIAILGGASIAGVLLLAGNQFWQVIVSMASRQDQIDYRLDFIQTALDRFSDSPLFGVGLGTFALEYGWIIHNTLIWFLAEFGILGVSVFIGFFLWFLLKGFYAYKSVHESEKFLILSFIIGHIGMLGVSMGIEALYQRHWWLIFAFIASGYSIVKNNEFSRLLIAERGEVR